MKPEQLKRAVKCYAPVYNVDEFNQTFKSSLCADRYRQLIDELGVKNKQNSINVAENYARRTKKAYLKRAKDIADNKYFFRVFGE